MGGSSSVFMMPRLILLQSSDAMYFCAPLTPAEIHDVLLRVPVSECAPSALGRQWRAFLFGQRCRARRVVPRARQENDGATFQRSGEGIATAPTRGREKAPCIAMCSSPLPLDPLSLLRARLGMPAARWGVAPDPHQGLRPWTPLRATALRTLLLEALLTTRANRDALATVSPPPVVASPQQ